MNGLGGGDPRGVVRPHPVFLAICGVTALGGWLAWTGTGDSRLAVVLFVAGGWIVSLSLHEFGHALAAYLGGDRAVVGKGYLTLNPLRYTEVGLSLVLPLLFLLAGGLGLPGGAVWINRGAIRSRAMLTVTSLAGPFASLVAAIACAYPFVAGWQFVGTRPVFAAALALLALVQLTSVVINLLPIPGLDGYGAIEPYLPLDFRAKVAPIGNVLWLVFFVLVFWTPAGSATFWRWMGGLLDLFDIPRGYAGLGLQLFQFWRR